MREGGCVRAMEKAACRAPRSPRAACASIGCKSTAALVPALVVFSEIFTGCDYRITITGLKALRGRGPKEHRARSGRQGGRATRTGAVAIVSAFGAAARAAQAKA